MGMTTTAGSGARKIAAPVGRPLRRAMIGARTRAWPPHSRLFVAGDGNEWAIADDALQIARVAETLGARLGSESWITGVRNQSVFHASQFGLFGSGWRREGNRIGVAYLHGQPGTPDMPEFDVCYDELRARHDEIDRVQVSCRAMEKLALTTGIGAEKIFRIPIGIDLEHFPVGDPETRGARRRQLEVPESAFVVGSFQKDGVGWGEGIEPKLIKGPDVFLDVLARARVGIPELFVLLTGPARGYVTAGLEQLGIPYRHVAAVDREGLAGRYHLLDAYLVASRDEGGPKAVLESMASGVPLVTTRVGQAADLVVSGEDGYLAEVEDAEALAGFLERIATTSRADLERLVRKGRETAESNSYDALRPRWAELLTGFVELEAPP
jgi:glycosyltransferase involved in cell wall biosynthesis